MRTGLKDRDTRKNIVVIGNGMVGQRFCEKLVAFDTGKKCRITTFCEEPRAAYDRVGLTSFFAHRDAEKLMLAKRAWYDEHGVELHVGDRANKIDRKSCIVHSDKGVKIAYDVLALTTGSYPFVPKVSGINKNGVFVYRTIEDLERIIAYGAKIKRAAILGGGLLGLEAAKAAHDLGLETHVVECAPRLMPRNIDDAGSRILVLKIEELGVSIHLNKMLEEVIGNGVVEAMRFTDGEMLDVDMIIVSAGICPRDELAQDCGLEVGTPGGIVVNDHLQTSDPSIYAMGEVVRHREVTYGLVAPGYEMADVVAANLTGDDVTFTGSDLSAKLKLLGVDVASFGSYEAGPEEAKPLTWEDPFGGIYKKLLFSHDGTRLIGGMLIGDAGDYGLLSMMVKSNDPLPCKPHELILGKSGGASVLGGVEAMPDSAQICSCNNVTKGNICTAIREGELTTMAQVKEATTAGTGCGGCVPLVTDLFRAEMRAAGVTVKNHLCEHFAYSRTEIFALIKAKKLKTFYEIIAATGTGDGCEICKPAITSILAGMWNENIMEPDHQTLQDSNDRFLANTQRGGLYSVIPRIAAGEITPDKLVALGETAKAYGLYTKITGGQRIDLFGAQVQDLPDIWEKLVAAGFESGHAYGKALRTIKSCVGTTWCRYGVQDSVGFAVRLENRYKGIRAPHKLKSAVSGCVRECAEAQGKDFGLVATEHGYNLYLCGNGGAKPRHADLFATDIDEETTVTYIDRFLIYYIMTADKLTRTSVWIEKLEGGIEHLKEVIIEDKLGICAELDERMQYLVDTYKCEWTEVVNDPERRKAFRQFVNTDETESSLEIISERGQQRPADWPSESVSLEQFKLLQQRLPEADLVQENQSAWVKVGIVSDFPTNGGATIKVGKVQIAVFNFESRGKWYACQQMCPHKKAFVLSRGIIGDVQGTPKVACPLHKKNFSLASGESLNGEAYAIRVFQVKVEGEEVFLDLPPIEVLDQILATEIGCRLATSCDTSPDLLQVL
ncbi:MAG: nitrite reductase large subunit NirB [Nitrospira sp.]|nr:nitrite reductase small subunit NirD [Candidatus Manganitrophaceae bacterium]HIL35798.1 nitrite reductase small subunit NirD [Candidatus Manganitrophaceae bacterium]